MKNTSDGYLLVSVLISTFLIVAIGVVTGQLVTNNYRIAAGELYRVNAQFAADAGADYAIQQLNESDSWTGTSSEVTLMDDGDTKLTYESSVTDTADPLVKILSITGRTYQPATATEPTSERKLEVDLRGVTGGISGSFSVVSGVGGLIMENNSKIVGGEVYVNGHISIKDNVQIGLTSNPVDVKAAHQNCPNPPDATYPRVCNSGENGQPISINNNAKIYGEVQATNQTNGNGMSSPGLIGGSPPPAPLPAHNRAAQVAAVSTTLTGSQASCSGNSTKVWPANLKVNGNVTIDGNCKVTVEGDAWITGKLTTSSNSELTVKNGLTEPPVIMVDGEDGFLAENNSKLKSNNSTVPIGFRIITYWSEATCSPDCTNVTGTDLFNSRAEDTIVLKNNASGPNTEFYARWSAVTVDNNGNVGALVGQTIKLKNNSIVTFGATISELGNTEVAAWVVKSYKRSF